MKVSIVMFVHNAEKCLSDAIESVLRQTFANIEFIIVDNDSTDQSENIINSFPDERIRLINRNHDSIRPIDSIPNVTGKYIACMATHCIMLPNKIETQYNYMENHPEIDVCSTFTYFEEGNERHEYLYPEKHDDIAISMMLRNSIDRESAFLRRNLFETTINLDCLCDRESIYIEEYKFWFDLIKKRGEVFRTSGISFKIQHECQSNKLYAK